MLDNTFSRLTKFIYKNFNYITFRKVKSYEFVEKTH